MTTFSCPHNESVIFVDRQCMIEECPYHTKKVKEFYNVTTNETACAYFDTDLMSNVPDSRTQISALSRHQDRRISPKLIRETFDTTIRASKTLYEFTHNTPKSNFRCSYCGYPRLKGTKCVSANICGKRKNWAKYVCSKYNIEPNVIKYQIIWELLFKNEIFIDENGLSIGFSLCSSKDVGNNPNIPINVVYKS